MNPINERDREIMACVRAHSHTGKTTARMIAAVLHIDESRCRKRIARLVETRWLVRVGRGAHAYVTESDAAPIVAITPKQRAVIEAMRGLVADSLRPTSAAIAARIPDVSREAVVSSLQSLLRLSVVTAEDPARKQHVYREIRPGAIYADRHPGPTAGGIRQAAAEPDDADQHDDDEDTTPFVHRVVQTWAQVAHPPGRTSVFDLASGV